MVQWLDYLLSTGQVAGYALVVVLIALVLGLVGWWIWRQIRYNKRVIVRVLTGGGGTLIKTDFAKEYKDKKTGAYMWRLKKIKHVIPRPHPKSISITKKGGEWVDVYYTGQGQYVPATASNPDFVNTTEFVKSFQPITESQRMAYTDQMDKAMSYKTKTMYEVAIQALPYLAVIIIIGIFMAMFNDTAQPLISMSKLAEEASEDFKIGAEIMRESVQTLRGVQVVGGPAVNTSALPD